MNIAKHLAGAIGLAALCVAMPANAQNAYVGQIITVGFPFCPNGTLEANGQVLPVFQYQALFSLYSTTYGGDGRNSFALPDLRGRAGVGQGSGPGLTPLQQGQSGGQEQVTLSPQQLPVQLQGPQTGAVGGTSPVVAAAQARPVPVRSPFVALRYCVVLNGPYPAHP